MTMNSANSPIVPKHKSDQEACDHLIIAPDAEVLAHIDPLLACLQDINWPIAAPVSDRLAALGIELAHPIMKILNGSDEIWKYWIISHLLYQIKDDVYQAIYLVLRRINKYPTQAERDEEVWDAVSSLLLARPRSGR